MPLVILNYKLIKYVVLQAYQIRCKTEYREEGERMSKYFVNLEKKNQSKQEFGPLINNKGELLYDTKSIMAETVNFYKDLYSSQAIDTDAQNNLLYNMQTSLDPKLAILCEGDITIKGM